MITAVGLIDGRRIRLSEDVSQGIQRGYRTVIHYDSAKPERTASIAGGEDLAHILLPGFGVLVRGSLWLAVFVAAFGHYWL
ncbi:hypothetical protein [Streptomyces roseifaciens]|uniref:hypothetical protein n=1 Tax=Streptomyces roseifaciens TaxID=1488406 RepID=UPI0007182316|nr:hypothetical protein [Streptomyces roseifaciens]